MVYYKANVEHIPTTDVIMVTQNPAGAIHASYIPFCFGHAFSPHSLLCMILSCHITDIMIKKGFVINSTSRTTQQALMN